MNKLPKLILSDIDGVWTDGSMYYTDEGDKMKRFHTYDSAGVLFCKISGIPVGIISGENHPSIILRARKLGTDYVLTGIKNKTEAIGNILKELGISWDDLAYIGDDINDLDVLKRAGLAATVPNAPDYIKKYVHYITQKKGGEGAFRDFVEYILTENNLLEEVLDKITSRNR